MKIAHVCCLSLLMASPLWAQTDAPISAIDWLSQPGLAPLTEEPLVVGDPKRGAELTEIDVVELDAPVEKTYGLIPSKISGIPQNFWTDLDPRMLRQILNAAPLSELPAADDLMLRALLAETLGAETILNTRVQALIERGATHAAYSLLGQTQIQSQESFGLFAETALLTGNIDRMCRQLNLSRHLSDNEALKVYCQARAGSWSTAELNYFTLNTLGAFTPTLSALLAADLDPELADDLSLPNVEPNQLTALEFQLRAGTGQSVPTRDLPLKFAPSDLSPSSDWKTQMEAAERLGAVGSLPAAQLLEKYKSGQPSASGGVWDRANAVQTLDSTLADPIIDPSDALLAFWKIMRGQGLAAPLAHAWSPLLLKFNASSDGDDILFQMQVLSRSNAFDFEPTMVRLQRINPHILSENFDRLMAEFDQDVPAILPFRSANVLRAIGLITDGLEGNEQAVIEAVALFRAMGLTPLAQQLAMEFMILADMQ